MQETLNPSPGFARNPDRKISLEPLRKAVTVKAGDVAIATSSDAKIMKEEGHEPVVYIPFSDISFASLERTDTRTHCPYKGDASYWRVTAPGEAGRDVMWGYEAPFDEMMKIKDHGAFFSDRVSVETR